MIRTRPLFLSAILLSALFCARPLRAQTNYPVEGYITASQMPQGFEVEGRVVRLTPATSFGLIDSNTSSTAPLLSHLLRVGAYVQVDGDSHGSKKPLEATLVRFRDDWNRKLSGTGVILRVVHPQPDPVYDVDGYSIRITSSTKVSFEGGLDSLAKVAENSWVRFSGKRGADGIVVATSADFLPGKPTTFKAVKSLELTTVKTRPAGSSSSASTSSNAGTVSSSTDGASMQEDQQIKIGLGKWHLVPADQPLQQRIHRIGIALVPEYQRDMPESDPSKIHFRFFAIDNPKVRSEICLLDGVILIPRQLVERFTSDDQVDAVLADGIPDNLQRQAARLVAQNRLLQSGQYAAFVASTFIPGAGLASLAVGGASFKITEAMQQERLRIALSLMRNAGFDPWQAPEAWRLAAPKELSPNHKPLPYPMQSCYQLNLLGIEGPPIVAPES